MNALPAESETHTNAVGRQLSRFSWRRQWRLTRKELAEVLRDRRTIITLVLMPLLVYPLLGMVFHQFVFSSLGKQGKMSILIGVADADTRQKLQTSLQAGERWITQQDRAAESLQEPLLREQIEPPLVEEPEAQQIQFLQGDTEYLIKNGRVDLVVRWQEAALQRPSWQIQFMERSSVSAAVRSFVERRLRAANLALRAEFAPQEEVPTIPLEYVMVKATSGARSLLPTLIPLVLLMMTITGAVYPAIDVTAGERERGTLEALVAAPVSRLGLLLAKYVAVLTVALLTAGVNMIAMISTIYGAGLAEMLCGSGGISFLMLVQVLGLLLLFASFFSAVLLAVTSFARSFKEAQAYLIPLMLLTLGPGLMSLSPTLELDELIAFAPLVNVVLLAREVFNGTAQPAMALVVIGATLVYAAISIAIAARIFGSDAILYGSSDTWSSLWRRTAKVQAAPSISAAMFALALLFAGQMNLGSTVQMLAIPWGIAGQLLAAAGVMALLFLGIPFIFAYAERIPLLRAFRVRGSGLLFWLVAILLGLSSGILVMELTVLGMQAGWLELRPELKQLLDKRAAEFQAVPLPLILATLALLPAGVEECFFRGYLFKALETRFSMLATIGVSSLCFAAFHICSSSGLVWERLLPSLLMGVVLGCIAWRSGSVLPGMVLHALNNAVLLTLSRYKDSFVAWQWLAEKSEHVPMSWLIVATIATLLGGVLLAFGRTSSLERAASELG